ncbi:beta-galactosidase, partial [Streptacidiphilus monticola]
MPIELRHGVLHRDGAPELLATADYPYYRDHPSVWRDRLTALRDRAGIRVVTCYLPWRHHQPDAAVPPDFTDVVRFLRLCRELGLDVIAKPGPFIHAETNYGGLPDWICPLHNPEVEPALRADGEPMRWNGSVLDGDGRIERWPLPSAVGPHFTARVTEWLRAVGKEVLAELTGPEGPVIAVQIANEGLFTDGALPLWVYDYSGPALAAFRDGLDRHYGGPAGYNAVHGTSLTSFDTVEPPRRRGPLGSPAEQLALADWGRFHSELLGHCYRTWYDALGTDVPVLVNLNPPAGDPHSMDDWLARVRPETWPGIHYGFTNWMGVVSTDPLAHARYVVAAKRAPGPNMEENWGFSELYDRAYAAGATSLHQTLLALAAGATGWNVYTGIATATWSDDLDVLHRPPYPDCPPVDEEGRTGHKAWLVRTLADYLARHGAEFLAAPPAHAATWGLYSPYAAVAAWSTDDPSGSTACGRPLRAFHDRMRAAGLDYRITDLEHADAGSLTGPVFLHGGPFLPARVQRLLAG